MRVERQQNKKQTKQNNKKKENIMATTYRFKTVMVSDNARAEFTSLRDSFGDGVRVTDKELFDAIFAEMDVEKVRERVAELKATQAQNREKAKIAKLEAKLAEKLAKLQTSEAPAEEVPAETEEAAA